MGLTRRVPPEHWFQAASGIWVRITALDDPLLGQHTHRVVGHRGDEGHVWLAVFGPNAGVRMQSVPPDTVDFADVDGGLG